TGNTKLIEVPIEEKHIPNIYLSALMISDANAYSDTKQVVVPPVERFLQVAVNADREQYQPREEGTLAISAKDAYGRPVSAEIALGLVDESVKYIQQDYAGDPRQFYYGRKRTNMIVTTSSLNQKRYARLQEVDGRLVDDRIAGAGGAKDQIGRRVAARGDQQVSFDGISAMTGNYMSLGGAAQAPKAAWANRDIDATSSELKELSYNEPSPPPPGAQEPVQVRNDFRSTILWLPDVKTDANGAATVKVKYPDSLTTWSATARAVTTGNQFGIGNTSTRTKQPLIVRLQAPRFFVVGDQVTVSGVINNNTDAPLSVATKLSAEGLTVSGLVIDGMPVKGELGPLEVKANSEARVDWLVAVTEAGEAKLKVEARADKYADAMEKSFTVYEHGIEKFVSRSGKMRSGSVSINLDIPKAR